MKFYLIGYSFPVYSDAMDDYYDDYAIQCSIVDNKIEAYNFSAEDLNTPSYLGKLMNLVIKKSLKTNEKLDDFLNS